ncbi:response regulator [Oceanobacillus halophilus]|uniref:Response regulator n=1 Tax=Oceanobacillus halophilus TaxID=930130 RepID=A0A494ZXS7_9BACI|nr:response regulator [Oceanobacillus halophilus]RKQ31554.1 response regulator [Oceanobacillus halophilus]
MVKRQILIVDDQVGIRLLLTDVLENEGYQVEEATTGKQALEKLHKANFDLIILDYKIPVMDGAQVLREMEEENVEVPAILMSGLAENLGAEVSKFKLVKKMIAKPFNINEFVEEVRAIID